MIEKLNSPTRTLDPVEKQYLGELGSDNNPHSEARRAADSSGDEFPIPSGPATDLVDPVLNLGHLSLEDGGKSRQVNMLYTIPIGTSLLTCIDYIDMLGPLTGLTYLMRWVAIVSTALYMQKCLTNSSVYGIRSTSSINCSGIRLAHPRTMPSRDK